jgi:hypothetical protein
LTAWILKRDTRQFADADKPHYQAKALLEEDTVETPFLAHLLDNMGVSAVRQPRFAEAEKLLLADAPILAKTGNLEHWRHRPSGGTDNPFCAAGMAVA